MKGAMEEVIEPAISVAFAIILAMVLGSVAYLFLDILGNELSTRHPSLLSLQYAGLTAAVASAPQKAVYCHKIYPVVNMLVAWMKEDGSSPSFITATVTENSATAVAFQTEKEVAQEELTKPSEVTNEIIGNLLVPIAFPILKVVRQSVKDSLKYRDVALYIGPMPQPYPVASVFVITKNKPFTVAMLKNETGIYVFEVKDLGECDALV